MSILPGTCQVQKKYYKQNIRTNRDSDKKIFDENLAEFEQTFAKKFSADLKTFLHWSCLMPIWNVPFIPFVESGKEFRAWSNRAAIIKIHLEKTAPNKEKKLEIMHGVFSLKGAKSHIFKVNVDVTGNYTGLPESVFLEYGKVKPNYTFLFKDESTVRKLILADSIAKFTQQYLAYLTAIPVRKKVFKKIDKLFHNPKKLFQYMTTYNWDDGQEEIEYVVNDKRCDKATALAIYWLSQPYMYDEKIGSELKMIPFVIEKNIKKGFYTDSDNYFDPAANSIADFIKEYRATEKRRRNIPDYMLNLKV